MLKKIYQSLGLAKSHAVDSEQQPAILERSAHSISRKQISKNALTVLYELERSGFEAYLVGGCIRDLLLDRQPKDFDVATNATPEQVQRLFKRARVVGRRFKIAHVRFGSEIIEVTTFRAGHEASDAAKHSRQNEQGMLLRDNVYGSLREDALRRDFTVNALYYSLQGFKVLDYTHGLQDLNQRLLRIIGDPEQRYREDPVRMLRAVRFAAKLDFELEPQTAGPLAALSVTLNQVAPARLFDETLKLFLQGQAQTVFELLQKHDLFTPLFPAPATLLHNRTSAPNKLITIALHNTDQRIAADKPVTPAFLYASLLWPALVQQAEALEAQGIARWKSLQIAGHQCIDQQQATISIPKRFSIPTREIWNLQYNLETSSGKRSVSLLGHPRFRAAYDFYLMREQAGESLPQSGQFWTQLQKEYPQSNNAASHRRHTDRRHKSRKRHPHKH